MGEGTGVAGCRDIEIPWEGGGGKAMIEGIEFDEEMRTFSGGFSDNLG